MSATAPVRQPERRRSQRTRQRVPLVVRGESAGKRPFREETHTLLVSAHGALLVLATPVAVGQRLVLVKPQTREEQEGQVAYVGPITAAKTQVAIAFTQPSPEFWPIASSP